MKNSLTIFTQAAIMLAEADTIQKTKELKDLALTAADFARRKGMGEEAIQHCRSYALEAERKMGEMLLSTQRNKGAKSGKTGRKGVPLLDDAPTLDEIGLNNRESSDAQALASVSKPEFEELKAGKITRSRLRSVLRRKKKKKEHEERVVEAARTVRTPVGPCDLVLADPPWRYEHQEADNRDIENQYTTATVAEICQHSPRVKPDSILLLWATAPKLTEALEVMKAWGFNYRSCAVWDKERLGMGYWWRIQHELLLVGVKGKPGCTPEPARRSSVFREPRGKHSAKPESVYEWIESAFPGLSKLEMYCRSPRKGWAAWGNEC